MPDTPVEPPAPRPYPSEMESRVAVLEQIARTTSTTLERLERRIDLAGAEVRAGFDGQRAMMDRHWDALDRLRSEQRADFRWLLGIMLAGFGGLLGVMAHGFHWL